MESLEAELKQALAAQVRLAPSVADLTTRVVERAGRVRRRRRMMGACALVVLMLLAGGTLAASHGGLTTEKGLAATPAALAPALLGFAPAGLFAGGQIVTAEGSRISLFGLPPVGAVWRVADGWLVRTEDAGTGRQALWLATRHSQPVRLADGDRIVVGWARTRPLPQVAWSDHGRVVVATIDGGGLRDRVETAGIGDLHPVALTATGVLLATTNLASAGAYDIWFPARGDFRPGPRHSEPIVGVSADGAHLFGRLADPAGCLGLIDPDGWQIIRSTCTVLPRAAGTVTDTVTASPDGRRIFVLVGPGEVAVYDLARVWYEPEPVATFALPSLSAVAWAGDTALVVSSADAVVRLEVSGPAGTNQARTIWAGPAAVITDLRDPIR